MPKPNFKSSPHLSHGPDHAPLLAWLTVAVSDATEIAVRISQDGTEWTIRLPVSDRYPLLGFHPTGAAEIVVQAIGPAGVVTWPETLVHQLQDVPMSPLEMPPLQTHTSEPDRMAGHFTFLTIRRRTIGRIGDLTPANRKWFTTWGMLIAVDNSGRMRWMRKLDRRAAGVTRLSTGNLFVHDTDFCSREVDMTGDTVRAWYASQRPQGEYPGGIPVNVRSLHHQPHQMPNGNFLALSAHSRHVSDWPASVSDLSQKADREIVGDMVVEFTPGGDVVWSWDAFDHLDVYRIGYDALDLYWHVRGFPNAADWTHGNGVTYDPSDDSVLVSLRLQDCVLKIDRASGEIVWILGDHQNWSPKLQSKLLTPKGEHFRWPWHMHNPRITSEGTIVLFDNGVYGARPGSEPIPYHKSLSRGVEYRVDQKAMTVEQVWASAITEDEVAERTWAMGDAHRLEETDTALVVHSVCMPHGRDDIGMDEDDRTMRHVDEFPSYARVLEYDRATREIIFDMTVRDEDEIIHWEAFSGVRVDSLYPHDSGILMQEGDHLERVA